MRITVDIDEAVLAELVKMTGERKKSPAVNRAVVEFVNRMKAKDFGRRLLEGDYDYPLTNDEVERQGL